MYCLDCGLLLSCIFDCYVGCTCLKSLSVCTLRRARRNALVNTKRVRMHWLHTSACLVAEVECALIGPLRSAFNTAIEAESFSIEVYNLETTQTAICHNLFRNKKRACSSYKLQAQSRQRTACVEVKTQSMHNAARCVN